MSNQNNNHWDQVFQGEDYHYGTEPNDFLREHFDAIPAGGRVLCIGEGEGRNAVFLAEQGYVVTALDHSAVGLKKTRELAQAKSVSITTVQMDLLDYEFGNNRWDGIVSIFCHLPPALRRKVHTAIPFALRPNGVMLLEGYRPKQLEYGTGGPSNVGMLYDLGTLEKEFQPLTHVIAQEVERHIEEGKGHQGISATVQYLGRHQNY